jgi:hypothetical protein
MSAVPSLSGGKRTLSKARQPRYEFAPHSAFRSQEWSQSVLKEFTMQTWATDESAKSPLKRPF